MYETAIKILKQLDENGFESYVVGGYPRDLYLGINSTDIDICTSAKPEDIKKLFNNIIKDNSTFGSLIIEVDNYNFEITTFRRDITYINNRKPIIKYVSTLKEDLIRRDFKMNTLCIDKYGNYINLLGAIDDLNSKLISCVDNPRKSIEEDSLRILRAIRFSTYLDFNLDSNLKEAIKEYGSLLENLSFYRKKEELTKIFISKNVKKGIDLIIELNLDKYLKISNFGNINYNAEVLGIWAQLNYNEEYPFTNSETHIINNTRKLLIDPLNKYNLYKYGKDVLDIVESITGTNCKSKYDSLPIHSKSDIDITNIEIIKLIGDKTLVSDLLENIEKEILNENLVNKNELIKKYIINNYVHKK